MTKPTIPRWGDQHDTELDLDPDEHAQRARDTRERQRHNRIARRYESALDAIVRHGARHQRIGDMGPVDAKTLEGYGITDPRARQAIQRALPGLVRSWEEGDQQGARRQAEELADSFADAWPESIMEQDDDMGPAELAAMVTR